MVGHQGAMQLVGTRKNCLDFGVFGRWPGGHLRGANGISRPDAARGAPAPAVPSARLRPACPRVGD